MPRQHYFVLSFHNIIELDGLRSMHIVPTIETEGKCVFECYVKHIYKHRKDETYSFTYDITCINRMVQQMQYIFNMWISDMVVSLHRVPFSKHEPLDYDAIHSRLNPCNQIWEYELCKMKNKTCKRILKMVVNA
jgi:hypothetical protein